MVRAIIASHSSKVCPSLAMAIPACRTFAAASESGSDAGFVWFKWVNHTFPRCSAGMESNRERDSMMNGCGISAMLRPGISPSAKKVPSSSA